jgi:hypothetical protein
MSAVAEPHAGRALRRKPLSPMRIWEAIAEAKGASPEGGVHA